MPQSLCASNAYLGNGDNMVTIHQTDSVMIKIEKCSNTGVMGPFWIDNQSCRNRSCFRITEFIDFIVDFPFILS